MAHNRSKFQLAVFAEKLGLFHATWRSGAIHGLEGPFPESLCPVQRRDSLAPALVEGYRRHDRGERWRGLRCAGGLTRRVAAATMRLDPPAGSLLESIPAAGPALFPSSRAARPHRANPMGSKTPKTFVTAVLSLLLGFLTLPAAFAADGLSEAQRAHAAGRYTAALRLYRPLAEAGVPQAQFALGKMYHLGEGTAPDRDSAVRWFAKVAAQGFADRAHDIRAISVIDDEVPPDNPLGIYSYKKAAQNGDAHGQYIFAKIYDLGRGVEETDSLAMLWYMEAASQGHTDAMAHLGAMLAYGDGVPEEPGLGVNYLFRAGVRYSDEGRVVEALVTLATIKNLMPGSSKAAILERRIDAELAAIRSGEAAGE